MPPAFRVEVETLGVVLGLGLESGLELFAPSGVDLGGYNMAGRFVLPLLWAVQSRQGVFVGLGVFDRHITVWLCIIANMYTNGSQTCKLSGAVLACLPEPALFHLSV